MGLEHGRQAGRGEGEIAGQIQLLQQLLGEPASSDTDLLAEDLDTLTIQLTQLQERLRDRDA